LSFLTEAANSDLPYAVVQAVTTITAAAAVAELQYPNTQLLQQLVFKMLRTQQ